MANKTDIVLIPKTQSLTNLCNSKPISLCSILYKLVAKVLENRLQSVIGKCIDSAQYAFVPKRLITDNMFVAYELLHGFRQRRTRKKRAMALKLDMSKAYDKIEWPFLEVMLHKKGFMKEWVDLLIRYISSTSYLVVVNGHRGQTANCTRGLR